MVELQVRAEEALDIYYKMAKIRAFEEKAAELYTKGSIVGFCHLYTGQEAVIVGISQNFTKADSIITSYRDHGHLLAIGVEPRYVMAELCGKITGCSKGKGGSMHLYNRSRNFFGGNGIVGAQVSIGTGLALAHKYKSTGGIAFIFFGDGAANQGQVYESFNMAAIWKLPALYILENNRYALATPTERSTVRNSLKKRGDPFGIRTICVDGMNLLEVIQKSRDAANQVREKLEPLILHVDTYRYKGHSMSDPEIYRSRSEVDSIRKTRDPIANFAAVLQERYGLDAEVIEKIDKDVMEKIEIAARFALDSPAPSEASLNMDVLL
ncbi:MAG: pyruvate dehydrogenase (acetyl-transferring) E1 component subunit alpha [Holosporales bacterium]|nr:pyruvate dehydrogenase (acetyl-transferring) E1 component subunit alpha [Holosporales bacterium]